MPRADVSVEFNNGVGGFGVSHHTTRHDVKGLDVNFADAFCSKHPKLISYASNSESEMCELCDEHTRALAKEVFEDELLVKRIDCTKLVHDHGCRCWRGHDCGTDPCHQQKQIQASVRDALGNRLMDDSGRLLEPNEMMVLAAEAASPDVRSMSMRLASLETENRALGSVLRQLVKVLPKETREALGCIEVLSQEEG